jgi:hypothetical protein
VCPFVDGKHQDIEIMRAQSIDPSGQQLDAC